MRVIKVFVFIILLVVPVLFSRQITFNEAQIVAENRTESPSSDKRLEGYIIYRQKDGSVEEIDRVSPDNKSYEIRLNSIDGYRFSVGVVDKNGSVSDIPLFLTPVVK